MTVKGNVKGSDGVGGIIGSISTSNTIVSIENCHFSGNVEGYSNVGGIIGRCTSFKSTSWVEKCSSKGSIKGREGGTCIGGIVGYMQGKGSIYDCSYSGNITGSACVGGIVGETENDQHGCYVDRCEFAGKITGHSCVGGVAGKSTNCTIKYSVSNAFIYGKTNVGGVLGNGIEIGCWSCSFTGYLYGITGCGGIVGTLGTEPKKPLQHSRNSIVTCYTYSYIVGQSEIGGIQGRKQKSVTAVSIDNCYVLSPQIISISNDNNIARVASDYSWDAFTDFSYALNTTKIIKEGIWDNHVIDNYQNGGRITEISARKKSSYVMGERDWCYWDFDKKWSIQENESYPYLQWQTTPPIVLSDLKVGDTSIKGTCAEDGIIYARVGDEIYSSSIHQSQWQINVPSLHSGEKIEVYSKSENKQYSNWVMITVKYEGEGTAESPYQISTAEDLQNIWQRGYYRLTKDIESDSCLLSPIIYVVDDTVTIDGDGHKITILQKQSDSDSYISDEDIGPYDNTGLFGIGYNVTLKNLIIAFPRDYTLQGLANVGAFVGLGKNLNLSQCAFYGNIEGGRKSVGSFVGRSKDSYIQESYAEGQIDGLGSEYGGGLVGYAENTVISDCISKSNIKYKNNRGGIVGENMSVVRNCYATGNIDAAYSGGICGRNNGTNAVVSNCFAINKKIRSGNRVIGDLLNPWFGGIVTPIPDSINYAWDGMIIETVINDGVPMNGYSKTNEQLMQRSTYEACGWDFDNVWGIDEGKGYPYLQWMKENVHTGIQKVATSGAQNKALISLARERIMIDSRGTSLPVTVYNLLGIRVYNGIVNGHLSIHLTSGTYIVVAGNQTKKVVL